MDKYEKISQGLTSCYTERAKKRMAEKQELQFNQSNEAYNKALNGRDCESIAKVVEALAKQRQDIYNKIFQTGGNDADIALYNELTSKLEKLQMHVEDLHSEGVI